MNRIALFLILCGGLLFSSNCMQINQLLGIGGNEEDGQNDQLVLAALLLALDDDDSSCSCQIGNVCFSPGSGVSCSNGTATGTGTLDGGTSGDFVSLAMDIQMTASGGTVTFNTGVSSDVSSKRTGLIVRTTTGHQYFANGGGDTSLGTTNAALASTASTTSYCLESHLTEGHLLVRSGGCPSSTIAADGTTDEEEGSVSADTGRKWSIILNNATISNVTQNSSEKFSG